MDAYREESIARFRRHTNECPTCKTGISGIEKCNIVKMINEEYEKDVNDHYNNYVKELSSLDISAFFCAVKSLNSYTDEIYEKAVDTVVMAYTNKIIYDTRIKDIEAAIAKWERYK